MSQKIIEVELYKLEEQLDNPNRMEDERFNLLVESIRANGFLQPILVSPIDGGKMFAIVDGHHRVRAARAVGMGSVPALLKPFDQNRDLKVVQVGMNKLKGELDLAKVAVFMQEAVELGVPMDYLSISSGFTSSEISDLLASVRGTTEDDILAAASVPEDEAKPLKPFVLEVEFSTSDELKAARRGLKRAAGASGDLGAGLLALIDGT